MRLSSILSGCLRCLLISLTVIVGFMPPAAWLGECECVRRKGEKPVFAPPKRHKNGKTTPPLADKKGRSWEKRGRRGKRRRNKGKKLETIKCDQYSITDRPFAIQYVNWLTRAAFAPTAVLIHLRISCFGERAPSLRMCTCAAAVRI